jgi:hypothetical protein
MVARRLVPLVVVLSLAFAPVALEACQTSCLSHDVETAASGAAHHHSSAAVPTPATPTGHVHHHTSGTAAPQTNVLMAAQHRCDHGGDLPAFAAAVNGSLVAPAVAASSIEFPQIGARSSVLSGPAARISSARIALTTQLRV